MGPQIPLHQPALAPALGADSALLRVPGRYPQGHLHDQRRRVSEHDSAQGDQDARLLPQRRSCDQAAVPGAAERRPKMAYHTGLAAGSESLRDTLGRALSSACEVN